MRYHPFAPTERRPFTLSRVTHHPFTWIVVGYLVISFLVRGSPPAASAGLTPTDYMAQVSPQMDAVFAVLDQLTGLLAAPLPERPAWREQVDAHVAVVRAARAEIAALAPPASFQEFHVDLLMALATCTAIPNGLPTGTASDQLLTCTEELYRVAQQADTLHPD
jgi:hypothetical protein